MTAPDAARTAADLYARAAAAADHAPTVRASRAALGGWYVTAAHRDRWTELFSGLRPETGRPFYLLTMRQPGNPVGEVWSAPDIEDAIARGMKWLRLPVPKDLE